MGPVEVKLNPDYFNQTNENLTFHLVKCARGFRLFSRFVSCCRVVSIRPVGW